MDIFNTLLILFINNHMLKEDALISMLRDPYGLGPFKCHITPIGVGCSMFTLYSSHKQEAMCPLASRGQCVVCKLHEG